MLTRAISYNAHINLARKKKALRGCMYPIKKCFKISVLLQAFILFSAQHLRTYISRMNLRNIRKFCLCSYSCSESFFQKKKKKRVHMHHLAHLQSRAFGPRPGSWGPTRANNLLYSGASEWDFPIFFQNSVSNVSCQ